jgi:hypothetical protein
VGVRNRVKPIRGDKKRVKFISLSLSLSLSLSALPFIKMLEVKKESKKKRSKKNAVNRDGEERREARGER